MAARPAQTRHTEEEYLTLENEAEYKNEYFDGQIIAMTGGSIAHALIIFNLAGVLYRQLKGAPCSAFPSEMRVKASSLYAYPDATIVCGAPEFAAGSIATLLNPTVIFEVLSSSTEAFDRGRKFNNYRQIPSLREYVLIAQDSINIERFERRGPLWIVVEPHTISDPLTLASVDCTLAMDEVYDRVDFD